MRTQWNTGTLYTPHGQRIVAVWEQGLIRFRDIDRGISGRMVCHKTWFRDEHELRDLVMARYDRGDYGWDNGEGLGWIDE